MAEKFSPAAGSSSQLSAPKKTPKPNRPSAIHVIETFLDQRNYKGVARKKEKTYFCRNYLARLH